MAFIVEDGTGKVDANSLVSVAFAKNYFAERNVLTFEDLDVEDLLSTRNKLQPLFLPTDDFIVITGRPSSCVS